MLTRLKVSGFKNLVDVDVRFGAFTCVAGANGVGKSNLFDAIRFLSALADRPLVDAALSVRDEGGRGADVRSLFHRVGDTLAQEMAFEAEMIVPSTALDDLGQEAKASITFLRYSLTLALRPDDSLRSPGSLELVKEELVHINLSEAHRHLLFPHHAGTWRRSVVQGERRVPYFISTGGEGANRVIRLHQDGGSSGRPLSRLATNLPRTVLSVASAAESPTALLARREMQSWRLLQLEPSAMRKPDELKMDTPTRVGVDGVHLAAALYHLARTSQAQSTNGSGPSNREAPVYGRVASRLAELIEDVDSVWVDRDEKRELLTLQVKDHNGTTYAARSLSDGTLRFLALAVLALEEDASGLLCLEEPENGIHPERIPAMLRLLQAIATDVTEPVGPENPLRQVIINTHSPAVVAQVPDDSLIVAELQESVQHGRYFKRVTFSGLPDTWREHVPEGGRVVARGKLMAYLNPVAPVPADDGGEGPGAHRRAGGRAPRVVDRPDLQLMLPFATSTE
jgi:predicted ATPase